jgi:SAM-dependent methyltransferase
MVAAFQDLPDFSYARLIDGRRILHFAPEPMLQAILRGRAAKYLTADYLLPEHDLRLDMCNMHQVESGSFDTVIACDVLEHVPDDAQAMRELFRVLAPGGTAVLSVPQVDGMDVKVELPPGASAEDRLRLAGQEDHQRIYGSDFPGYLVAAGFQVACVNESSFPSAMVRRYTLFPPVLSSHPLATNHRTIYFARKP